MSIDKTISQVEKSITTLHEVVDEPLKDVIGLIKRHKKIIIVLTVVYFVWNYLFSEE